MLSNVWWVKQSMVKLMCLSESHKRDNTLVQSMLCEWNQIALREKLITGLHF